MELTVTNLLVPLVVALLGTLPSILLYRRQSRRDRADTVLQSDAQASQSRKDTAEASAIIAGASVSLIPTLQAHITELEDELAEQRAALKEQAALIESQGERITALERQNNELRHGAGRLISQLEAHDMKPVWGFDQLPASKQAGA